MLGIYGEESMTGAVTCPQAIRTEAHRANLQAIWQSPEWKSAAAHFRALHPDHKCERCGRIVETIVPGHTSEDYHDMPSYVKKVRENRCEALCGMCNWQESKGKKPCPECVRQEKKRIRYIGQYQEECFHCLPDTVREKRKTTARSFKQMIRNMQDKENAYRRAVYQEIKIARKATA
jgi:hypothetical protein